MNHNMLLEILLILLAFIMIFVIIVVILGELLYRFPRIGTYSTIAGLKQVTLKSDGKIFAWYSEENSKVALLIHGHADHSGKMAKRYRELFNKTNHDVFLIDLRNHGQSFRSWKTTFGIKESRDVISALTWIHNSKIWKSILIFGTSMGGIATLLALAKIKEEAIPISGVILDSIFLKFDEVLKPGLKAFFIYEPLSSLLVLYFRIFKRRMMGSLQIMKTLELIFPVKTLVIHGTLDKKCGFKILEKIDKQNFSHVKSYYISQGKHSRLYLHKQFYDITTQFINSLYEQNL